MSEIAKIEGVDHVYGEDWEVTYSVDDLDMLTDDTDEVVTVYTLVEGPVYYAFRARRGLTRIFTTFEEAETAAKQTRADEDSES